MAEKSRVKFNPVTKEMEIEGSEAFVKATLDKLQAMLSGSTVKKVAVKKIRPSEKAPKVAIGIGRGKLSKAVMALINGSPEGIAMAELKERTGLKESQIRGIIFKAKKIGKIKQVKWGVYGAA